MIDCYKDFKESGRMEHTRQWIDSGNMSQRLSDLLTEMMTIIDCQQAVIMIYDEEITQEYQEVCR
jgi:hypothetical protein